MRELRARFHSIAALFSVLLLAACQTTTGGGPGPATQAGAAPNRVSWTLYTPFYDQADHLAKLVGEGAYDDAAKLYAEQKDYFAARRDKARDSLERLAAHLNDPQQPVLADAEAALSAVAWPAGPADWPGVGEALKEAGHAIAGYPSAEILKDPEFRAPRVGRVTEKAADLGRRIREDAARQFAAFDHFGAAGFFESYPVDVRSPGFVRANMTALAPKLEAAGTRQLSAFAGHFTKDEVGDETWGRLGDRYVAAALGEAGATGVPDLRAVLKALGAARAAGFAPRRIPGLKIAFVEVTSRTLLREGQIEFPVAVDVDLPVAAVRAELDKALIDDTAEFADYTIVFDVALAKASRKVTGTRKMPGRVLVGHRTEPNPAYNLAQYKVNRAQVEVQTAAINAASAGNRYCQGLGCLGNMFAELAAAARQSEAKKKLDAAMAELAGTSMTVDIPIYQNYRYDKAAVKSTKVASVHYYVVDRHARSFFKSSFDIEEEKRFQVAYSVAENDPDRTEHFRDADSEKDVARWEEAATTVPLTRLVDHYLKNAGEQRPLPQLSDLREEMLADKNQALARYREQTYEGSTQSDPRFDSVVVIYMPDGGLGSGFFVRPDVVLTNYHVVKEGEFTEMKMYGGQETFGKVIARDVIRDLALIKVQARGKPVEFYAGNKLELGSTVEVIGHPRRFEFAITRGVISAVRRLATKNIDTDRKVLQVQIDAATSPGNSGGPVFLKDRVVGVVSWGRVDPGSENLNFTIHYAEARSFIAESIGAGS